MPNYKFKCSRCGGEFHSIEKHLTKITECKRCGDPAHRVFCNDGGSFVRGVGYWAGGRR